MEAIILAAGRGRRMKDLTPGRPKCMLLIKDQSIIERLTGDLLELGIMRITICVGYGAHHVVRLLRKRFPQSRTKIRFVYNPLFNLTNNAFTLWLARRKMRSGFLLVNGDNVLENSLIGEVMNYQGTVIPIKTQESYEPEDMKVQIDDEGYVIRINKNILENIGGESIGIRKISSEDAPAFWSALQKVIMVQHRFQAFYTETFQTLIEEGAKIPVVDVTRYYCDEIDCEQDLYRVYSTADSSISL